VAAAALNWPILNGVLSLSFDARVLISSTIIAIYSLAAAYEFARGAAKEERYRLIAAALCTAHSLFYLVRAIFGPTLGFANASAETVVSVWGAVIALEVVLFAAALATLVVGIALQRAGLEEGRAAMTDFLTGVRNRRAFELTMRTILPAHESNAPAVLLLLDLDRFKEVNDRLGHEAGDELLKGFVLAVRKQLPDPDMFWRLGGDEFAVMLSRCEPPQAESVKDSLRRAVEASAATQDVLSVTKVSVSIGSAAVVPGEMLPDLVRRADAALYQDKSKRRLARAPAHSRQVAFAA
jgi:diguanylate cyclase (GGDEF)-like protein